MPVNELMERLGRYEQSDRKFVASGKLWPNGEFSVGYARVNEEVTAEENRSFHEGGRYLTGEELDARLAAMLELLDEVERFYSMHAQLACSGLSLSNVWNSHELLEKTKNGLKGLSGYGTKMLRSACYLLEQRLGNDDVVMVTLTVPRLDRVQRVRLAQGWGQLTSRLVQWLSRALVRAGRTPVVAGCVEVQTRRLKNSGEGYLHLHLVCPAHSNTGGVWAIQASALRTWWKQAIERVVGCTLTRLPRIETAIVEKSVEGYLGKYLSKGTGEELEAFIGDCGVEAVPGQWWFMSAPMREAVKSGMRSGKNAGALLDAAVNHLLEMGTGEGFEYIRHIDCLMGDRLVTVGYVGRLSPDLAQELRDMLEQLRDGG